MKDDPRKPFHVTDEYIQNTERLFKEAFNVNLKISTEMNPYNGKKRIYHIDVIHDYTEQGGTAKITHSVQTCWNDRDVETTLDALWSFAGIMKDKRRFE